MGRDRPDQPSRFCVAEGTRCRLARVLQRDVPRRIRQLARRVLPGRDERGVCRRRVRGNRQHGRVPRAGGGGDSRRRVCDRAIRLSGVREPEGACGPRFRRVRRRGRVHGLPLAGAAGGWKRRDGRECSALWRMGRDRPDQPSRFCVAEGTRCRLARVLQRDVPRRIRQLARRVLPGRDERGVCRRRVRGNRQHGRVPGVGGGDGSRRRVCDRAIRL